jgi:hypothetical protein
MVSPSVPVLADRAWLCRLARPALVMVGDSDEEIPIEHTLAHGSLDARIVIEFLTDREEAQ